MDVHPIPQNVTSFQFKLIGDMTLKQFGYLAGGATVSYLMFIFFAHSFPLIAWPIIICSAILGISFAFLPVGSRPLDYWLAAFLKAVYSPTVRVWRKNGKSFKENPSFNNRLMMYLNNANQDPINQQTSKPAPNQIAEAQTPRPAGTPAELPTQEELSKTVNLARQAQQLQMKIIQTERTLSQIKTAAQKPTPVPVDYGQQVNKILDDLQSLVSQASTIKQEIQSVTAEPQPESASPPPPVILKEKVKVVIPAKPKQTQIALTTFPNVINGIVKNKENDYLEGVVAVIYDKEGLPVRALKTNKLGQFTGSTPLPNGTYTLELEKEGLTFDVLQMELTGQVLPPLLIAAKE